MTVRPIRVRRRRRPGIDRKNDETALREGRGFRLSTI